jgi:hypothetical protein
MLQGIMSRAEVQEVREGRKGDHSVAVVCNYSDL